jgi:outer membrane protein OmpA-like peptidoglycan-associated protein
VTGKAATRAQPDAPHKRPAPASQPLAAETPDHASSAARRAAGVGPAALRPADLLSLQRDIGNVAVQKALDAGVGLVPVARKATPRKAPPKPETAYDITGFYHVPSYATTLQVNSAGDYFVGWMQVRRSGKRFETSKLEGKLAYTPNLTMQGTYTRAEGALSVSGVIKAQSTPGGIKLELQEQGWRGEFERESGRARLPESAIAGFPSNVRDLVRAGEEMALTPPDRKYLDRQLRDVQLLVESYSKIDVTDRDKRRERASQINTKAGNSLDRFAGRVMPAVHTYIRNSLAALPDIKMRSAFDWLTIMATEYPAFTSHYEPLFGVKRFKEPEAGGQQHRYRIRTHQGGVAFGAGVTGGRIEIEKLGPDKWQRTYHFAAFSLGVGASVSAKGVTGGATVGTWAEFTRGIPYGPDDFYGPFTMTAGSVKIIGVEIADSYINFEGDGSLPVLTAPSGGPVSAGFAGVGIELSRATGRIFGSRQEAIRWARAQRRTTASAVDVEATGTSFGVDDAELTPDGRQNMRRFCALNRAILESPRTQVKVLGYTSTTASKEHNQMLSDLRAANTVQAMRELLGGDLKARVSAKGLGEEPARKEDPDEMENPKWRKVELLVNGRVTTTLRF